MQDLEGLRLRRGLDALLAPWSEGAVPGVTIGVVRDGALLEHRSAGYASLELGVPIGPATTFRIASVSKQFTTAAILLLAAEGRLAAEDEARRHLPELPDFGTPITVAHLMHNTSGIRDMLELMRLGGVDLDHPVASADLLAAIGRQRALNFAPGTRYLYSNSNFLLLGLIVERLSGQSLPDFLHARIFDPLGMSMTRMTPNVMEPVRGLATGYFKAEGGPGWVRAGHAFPLGGEGGLVSSVEDLALWAANGETGRVGGPALVEALRRQAPFANGTENSYARGLQAQDYRGLRVFGHGGLWPGYKTQFMTVPDRRLAVIAISNNAAADPYHLALAALDLLVDGTPGVRSLPSLPPREVLMPYAGRWLNRDTGATADIELDGSGTPVAKTHGVPFRLRAGEDGRLVASRAARDFAARLSDDGIRLEVEADAGVRTVYTRAPDSVSLPPDLPGIYANPDLAARWTITAAEDGIMTLRIAGPVAQGATMRVVPVEGDMLRFIAHRSLFDPWLDVRVRRDGAGRIVALAVDGGRARGFVFERLSDCAC